MSILNTSVHRNKAHRSHQNAGTSINPSIDAYDTAVRLSSHILQVVERVEQGEEKSEHAYKSDQGNRQVPKTCKVPVTKELIEASGCRLETFLTSALWVFFVVLSATTAITFAWGRRSLAIANQANYFFRINQ